MINRTVVEFSTSSVSDTFSIVDDRSFETKEGVAVIDFVTSNSTVERFVIDIVTVFVGEDDGVTVGYVNGFWIGSSDGALEG